MSAPASAGLVEIQNINSELVLDIAESGGVVQRAKNENRPTQRWQLTPVDGVEGLYHITRYEGGGRSGVSALAANNDAYTLAVRPLMASSSAQRWALQAVPGAEDTYEIESQQYPNKVLSVYHASHDPGESVVLWENLNQSNQRWTFSSRQPDPAVPVGEFFYINHLLTGIHLNTQGYVGNVGDTFLFHDRNTLDWRGEGWVFESAPNGTYYINVGVAFDDRDVAVDPNRTANNPATGQRWTREEYKIIYKTSKKRRLTFDSTSIPSIPERLGEDAKRYPVPRLDPAVADANDPKDGFQRWILTPSGILDSFSLHPVGREDLTISPRNWLLNGPAVNPLCLIPFVDLSQLFKITVWPF